MNQIKRRSSFTSSIDDRIKKLRKNTCFEDLSNELFYEIFDYLDGCDAHKTFSKLNIRFENLLKNSLLPLKIRFLSKSQSTLEQQCRNVIIPNKHRILSLHLSDQSLIRNFFDHCNIDSSFNRLESVVLNGLSAYKLMTVLFYLYSLPRLAALTIQLEEDYFYNLNDIYRLIFRLPYLKYNKLSISDYEESEILIPKSINDKPSTIEHLIINLNCTLDEISSLLVHTPHLRKLTCARMCETDDIVNKDMIMQLTLSELTEISITDCDIGFDQFEMFIKRISSKLQKLRLKASSFPDYLDANRWKLLIKKHIPYLHEFYFNYYADCESFQDMTPNIESMRQFTSSFWTERRWYFEFRDGFDHIAYSIHPYKTMWFDHYTDRSDRVSDQYTIKSNSILNEQQSDRGFNQSIQLIIEDYSANTWDTFCIDDMKPCFTAISFTYLNINCDDIPIGALIEIIRLLPNLEILQVSSLPPVQLNNLSIEDTELLLLVSINNKISKVKLSKMNGIEQLYFLMNLCSRMQYLAVECTTENDLENIIGCIAMNNIIHIPYLSCLCLCVPNANETVIKKLDKIIEFERLFHIDNKNFRDYVVQRIQNKIFLNWKL